MSRQMRRIVASRFYWDIDIVNAHPSLLSQLRWVRVEGGKEVGVQRTFWSCSYWRGQRGSIGWTEGPLALLLRNCRWFAHGEAELRSDPRQVRIHFPRLRDLFQQLTVFVREIRHLECG